MNLSRLVYATVVVTAITGCSDSATEPSKTPKLTASSQSGDLGPQGLVLATPPGWHSVQPPKYPESLMVDFHAAREIKLVGFLRQDGQPARAPKALRVEVSADGNTWVSVAGTDDACSPNMPDGWVNVKFGKPTSSRYLKIIFFSNCGDPQLLTLRGLRFE